MLFFFGLMTGLLVSILFFVILIAIKRPVEKVIRTIETHIPQVKQKGFILEPTGDAEDARQEIINRNKAEGKDTKLSELYDY